MTATNINWSVDIEEFEELFDYLTDEKGAEILKISVEKYRNETLRADLIKTLFRRCPGKVYDILGLPESVELPEEIQEEDAADYLSDTYGYCLDGFDLEKEVSE